MGKKKKEKKKSELTLTEPLHFKTIKKETLTHLCYIQDNAY